MGVRRGSGRFWILLATILGSSLVFVDGTVVSLALPTMQERFHASAGDAQWIVEAYAIALGALMLLGGALGDRFGRKRIFIIGVAIFTFASIWCGAATSMSEAIVARIAQGIGGMLLAPASLALLAAHFTGKERGAAIGTWSALTAIATTIGPVLGGVLIDHFSWRAVFLINVPLAAVVLAATLYAVDESRDSEARGALDLPGSVLITAGLAGVVYALIVAPVQSWSSPRVILAFAGGAVALAAFPLIERRARNPIVPLALFRSSTFAGVNIVTLLVYAALGGSLYFLPFLMIQVHGYSATAAGLGMLPFVLVLFVLSRPAGAVLPRFGPRTMLAAGTLVLTLAFVVLALLERNASYWSSFFPAIALLGVGMGIIVAPLTTTVMDSVSQDHMGTASGINSAVSRVAGLLAIAVLGGVLWQGFNAGLDRRIRAANVTQTQRAAIDAQRARLSAARFSDPQPALIVHAAYADGFAFVALSCGALALAGAIVSAVAVRRQTRSV